MRARQAGATRSWRRAEGRGEWLLAGPAPAMVCPILLAGMEGDRFWGAVLTPRGTPAPLGRVLLEGAGRAPERGSWQEAAGLRWWPEPRSLEALEASFRDRADPRPAAPGLASAAEDALLRLRCLLAVHLEAPGWVHPDLRRPPPPGWLAEDWPWGAPPPPWARAWRLVQGHDLPWTEPSWLWLQRQPSLLRRRIQADIERRTREAGLEVVDLFADGE